MTREERNKRQRELRVEKKAARIEWYRQKQREVGVARFISYDPFSIEYRFKAHYSEAKQKKISAYRDEGLKSLDEYGLFRLEQFTSIWIVPGTYVDGTA